MGDAEPSDERRDHGRLSAASHDVQEQSATPDFLGPEYFMGINDAQERVPLMLPERAGAGGLIVRAVAQEVDVTVRLRLDARVAVAPPLTELLFVA